MATCLCKQPCERHKFPVIRSKNDMVIAALAFKKENPEALVLVNTFESKEEEQRFMNKWGYE